MSEIDTQAMVLPRPVRLTKRVPGEAAEQFCLVQVKAGLFGEGALLIERGRVGMGSRQSTKKFSTFNEALTARKDMLIRLECDGYEECPEGEEP